VATPDLLAGFRDVVRRHPPRIALREGGVGTTYAQLDADSSGLARKLRSLGVGPGVLVGVALHRSARLVTALFAIVKAGGAYVPLDPDYPSERLRFMVDRARVRVVLTVRDLVSRLPAGTPCLRLDVAEDIAGGEEGGGSVTVGAEDPLYAIFTSGSTGEPKGAVVTRGGFANLLEWFAAEFSVGPDDLVLLLSSPSFDLTQKNFFAPLNAGASIVFYPSGPFDLTRLADLIEGCGITILNCTPSAFYPLVDTQDPAAFARLDTLRLAILGGEPISVPRVRAWMERPSCRAEIANTYGPTECTDICAFYRLNRANLGESDSVPLGRAIPNVQLAVVDDALRPVGCGEEGELIIGGAGVGPGYLGDPALTAERFVANPLPDLLGGPRVYRTGDRVRIAAGGVLEFLGRMDHQVKLRGFRIELPEIEAVLASHPAVRAAVAVIRESPSGPELAAYYLAVENARDPGPRGLLDFLASRLPSHMVPSSLVAMDGFPLTPNGKVDRLLLAKISRGTPAGSTPPVPPAAGGLEATVLALWREVLPDRDIGLDVSFFDLGGDSIQLARVHSRLSERLSRAIPITDLFANPTIRSLARHLSGGVSAPSNASVLQRAQNQRRALAARVNPRPRP